MLVVWGRSLAPTKGTISSEYGSGWTARYQFHASTVQGLPRIAHRSSSGVVYRLFCAGLSCKGCVSRLYFYQGRPCF